MCLFGVTNEGNEEEVGYIYGVFRVGLGGFGPNRLRPKGHSKPRGPLATARLRVMVSGRGFGSHIYIYNTYIHHISCTKVTFSFNNIYIHKILQGVRSEKPRVSHYPQVLRTFVPKVKAATAKLACFNGVSHHPPVSLEFRPEIRL